MRTARRRGKSRGRDAACPRLRPQRQRLIESGVMRVLIVSVMRGRGVRRARRSCTESDRRTQPRGRLADLQPRSRRHPLLAADADQHEERLDARPGVVVSTAARAGQVRSRDRQAGELVRNLSAGHAHRREWRDVPAVGPSRRRPRAGDREGDLALRAARRTRLVPRRRVLARRRPPARRASSSRACES